MRSFKISGLVIITCIASFFSATGCTKQAITAEKAITDSSSRTFLALGDSYTIGQSVSLQDRFPAQTAELLKAKGIAVSAPQYIAQTGWTTEDLQYAINQANIKPVYNLVTLLIGVNDQYQGLDTAGYRKRFTQLLQKAIEFASNNKENVVVLSIPDYGVTPFGGGVKKISEEIDAFNAINKQVTIAYGVSYIDITPISREVPNDVLLTANDGLHPSGKQYGLWAKKLVEMIK